MPPRPKPPFAQSTGTPLIIAHRGGSLEVPENTLAALRHGIACHSSWQEVDVTLSRDGHVVIIHDDTLERTTSGRGAVQALTLAELQRLRAGAPQWTKKGVAHLATFGVQPPHFGMRYGDEAIPTLAQALGLPGLRLMIELKTTPAPKALAQAVIDAVHAAQMDERVALGSFDVPTMQAVAALAPHLPRIGIFEDVAMLAPFVQLGVDIVAVDTAIVDAVLRAAPPHVAVWTWTVYTEAQGRAAAAAGAHGLITDVPERLVRAFGQAH